MDKNQYLELARKNGWNKKIPRLKDGTYDCDIFGGDYVGFGFNFHISGSIALRNHSLLCKVQVDEDVYLEDFSAAYEISAGGNTFIGDYSKITYLKTNHGNVCVGDFATISYTISGSNVEYGDNVAVLDVSSEGFISFGKNSDIYGDLKHKNGIFFKKS